MRVHVQFLLQAFPLARFGLLLAGKLGDAQCRSCLGGEGVQQVAVVSGIFFARCGGLPGSVIRSAHPGSPMAQDLDTAGFQSRQGCEIHHQLVDLHQSGVLRK